MNPRADEEISFTARGLRLHGPDGIGGERPDDGFIAAVDVPCGKLLPGNARFMNAAPLTPQAEPAPALFVTHPQLYSSNSELAPVTGGDSTDP